MNEQNRNGLKDTENILMVLPDGRGAGGMIEKGEGIKMYNLVVTE